ncbi:MAG: Crp/Fnr family transcriptional regulator [Hyphomicrobiaceae bacterium]
MSMRQITCRTCAIRHRSICSVLSENEIAQLNSIAKWKQLSPGQVIFRDREEPVYFANIVAGVVKLSKTLIDGRQQIVGLQFPTDFLGRPYRPKSPYFAEAANEVTLCTFERGRFERLAEEFPGIGRRLFEHTLDELDAAQEWMVVLGRKSAGEKLASFLLMIAKRAKRIGCSPQPEMASTQFDLALSRSEIADFLGLTIETVSRQFTLLRRRGVIVLEGTRSVIVPDIGELERTAEQSFG